MTSVGCWGEALLWSCFHVAPAEERPRFPGEHTGLGRNTLRITYSQGKMHPDTQDGVDGTLSYLPGGPASLSLYVSLLSLRLPFHLSLVAGLSVCLHLSLLLPPSANSPADPDADSHR